MNEFSDNTYEQSSVIPIYNDQVVLITSNRTRRWIVPKGLVESDMTPQESAAQEALEEAGLVGTVTESPIAYYEYEKWKGICHVTVYEMKVSEVHEDWDEKGWRDRKIVTPSEAVLLIEDPTLKEIVKEYLASVNLLAE